MQDSIEQAITRLGYNQDWLDLGIVSESLLLQQLADITTKPDCYAEHCRHRAFDEFLDRQSKLSDQQIKSLMQLVDSGKESFDLHNQRMLSLLYSGLLSEQQFKQLNQYHNFLEDPVANIYQRTKLIRAIKKHGLSAVFAQVKNSTDNEVQRFALSIKGINLEQIQWFRKYGCSRTIRNLAKNKT